MTKVAPSCATGSFQQRYLDGLEELVELHRELSSLEGIIEKKKEEILILKRNSKKRKLGNVEPAKAKKSKKPASNDQIYWKDLVIKHFANAFNDLTLRKKQQLKESVLDFLRLKLDSDQIKKLQLPNQEYGIPSRLVDPFISWLKRQMVKITQITHKKKNSPASKKVFYINITFQKKPENKPVSIWRTWAETIRQKLSTYRVESIHSHFAKSFLARQADTIEQLREEDKISSSSSKLCIPDQLTDVFLEEFFRKFPRMNQNDMNQTEDSTPKGSILSPTTNTGKSMKITAWPDICNAIFPLEMTKILSSLELEKNVSWSVGKFVAENIGKLKIELADCIVDSTTRSIKTFGIPISLESQFMGWFKAKLQTGFDAYLDSADTIESGLNLQQHSAFNGAAEEDDLNSQEISGLLDQLFNPQNTKKDNVENDESTAVSENNFLGAFESLPPPSPIWSFSWLSEPGKDESQPLDLTSEQNATVVIDPSNKKSEIIDSNEAFSKADEQEAVNLSANNCDVNIPVNADISSTYDDFVNLTPARNAAEANVSPPGSPVELTPDCSPDAVSIQSYMPPSNLSDLKKNLFGSYLPGKFIFPLIKIGENKQQELENIDSEENTIVESNEVVDSNEGVESIEVMQSNEVVEINEVVKSNEVLEFNEGIMTDQKGDVNHHAQNNSNKEFAGAKLSLDDESPKRERFSRDQMRVNEKDLGDSEVVTALDQETKIQVVTPVILNEKPQNLIRYNR